MNQKKDNKKESALHVNPGVDQPSSINEQFLQHLPKSKNKILDFDSYINGIKSGNISILSRAITLIESSLSAHQEMAQAIIEACLSLSGNSIRIGISGVPGAGKSTFIESFGEYLCSQGKKLAVLAIDPSSERSKGSILGDKTRMEKLSVHKNAYIRPSPSAGTLGGVARKTRESIILCEAAGFDTIFIETVGVGQSETAAKSMGDFFMVLMLAGAGDELQGIKRGIMEMADALLINKADGDNLKKAEMAASEYKNALHYFAPAESQWETKVEICSALTGFNINKVWEMIQEFAAFSKESGFFTVNRAKQEKRRMHQSIAEKLHSSFYENPQIKKTIAVYEKQIDAAAINPYKAAQEIFKQFLSSQKNN